MKAPSALLLLIIPALVEARFFSSWRLARNAPSLSNILFDNPGCPEINIRALAGGESESVLVVSYSAIMEADFETFREFMPQHFEDGKAGVDEDALVDALSERQYCGRVNIVELDSLEDLFDANSWLYSKLITSSTYTVLTSLTPSSIELLTGQPTASLQSLVFSLIEETPTHDRAIEYFKTARRRLAKLLEGATQGWCGAAVVVIWIFGLAAIVRRVRRIRRDTKSYSAAYMSDDDDSELLERSWELTDGDGEKFVISIEQYE